MVNWHQYVLISSIRVNGRNRLGSFLKEKKVCPVQPPSLFIMLKLQGGQQFSLFFFCLFNLFLYVPSTIFQINRDWSSWVKPVLS